MRRGSVLVQVLIMGTLMLILATALLKMIMGHYTVSMQVRGNARARNEAEAALNMVASAWAAAGQSCASVTFSPTNIVDCGTPPSTPCGSGASGEKACTCAVTVEGSAEYPRVIAETVPTPTGGTRCQTRIEHTYGSAP